MSEAVAIGWVPEPQRDFGARLALVRQRMAWNMREAARECALDPASWRMWEQHSTRPRDYVEVCRKISISTGCSLPWLMGVGGEGVGRVGLEPTPGGL